MEGIPAGVKNVVAEMEKGRGEEAQEGEDPQEEDDDGVEKIVEESCGGGEVAHL